MINNTFKIPQTGYEHILSADNLPAVWQLHSSSTKVFVSKTNVILQRYIEQRSQLITNYNGP